MHIIPVYINTLFLRNQLFIILSSTPDFPKVVPRSEVGCLKFDKQFSSLPCMMHIFFTMITTITCHLAICTVHIIKR